MTLKKRIMQIQGQLYQSAKRKQYWPIDTHEKEEESAYNNTIAEDFV